VTGVQTRADAETAAARARTIGLVAMCAAVLCFSVSSTIIKKAGIPGPTIAFWRMLATTFVWWAMMWASHRRTPTRAELRRAIVPGMVFGLNITCFFTAVTRTSIANAEFIGALTPIVLVPAGALLFHEKANLRALSFGLVSLLGLVLVLFKGPSNGVATLEGNLYVLAAMILWAVYLLTSRRLRTTMDVQTVMASIMPVATLTILPIVVVKGELLEVTARSVWFIAALSILTGTLAHGFIVFAQRAVPVGTIGILQVAQPALAVGWAYVFLDQGISGLQVIGMALVIAGLVAVVTMTRRTAPLPPEDDLDECEADRRAAPR
jgi:drug/metabolite transporter (DMT)-like permease